jgi:Protein of unknown function (DUF3489)
VTIFTIDHDNNITAFASVSEAKSSPKTERFRSAKELARLAAAWPSSRLIEIWNSLPGVSPVRKFTSRQVAVNRIWTAIHSLAPDKGVQAGRAKRATPVSGAREGSTTATVLELLKRREGATLKELMAATEWQAHSVRGFLKYRVRQERGRRSNVFDSGLNKKTFSS